MSRVYQIEFTDYEKEKNKELSRYDRFSKKTDERKVTISPDGQTGRNSFFDSMRVVYYGDNWLQLLFPSLFFNKC